MLMFQPISQVPETTGVLSDINQLGESIVMLGGGVVSIVTDIDAVGETFPALSV